MHEIKRVGVLQAAKLMAIMYLIVSAVIVVPLGFIGLFTSATKSPAALLVVLLPVVYAVFGFVFTAIGCWVYNVVAAMVGGFRIELDLAQPPAEPKPLDPAPAAM